MNLFFKKNQNKKDTVMPENQAKENKIDEGIEIHSMPEKYRTEHVKVSQAKMTGIIILSTGVIVLFALATLMYYVLFANNDKQIQETTLPELNTKQEKILDNETKQETSKTNEQSHENISAGILPDISEEDIATSTQEEIINPEEYLPPSAIKGIDSDGDDLTDSEEQLLGTDLSQTDTDSDGYGDLIELNNLYNPAGAGKLIENLNIKEIKNTDYNYTIYYPAEWTTKISDNYESVLFTSADNHFVQIIVQPNDSGQTINNWYREQFDVTEIETELFVLGNNWTGLKSLDGLTVYLNDKNQENIFALTYNIGSSNILEYKNIFDVMVNSFKFID